jgi:hypothetical protein
MVDAGDDEETEPGPIADWVVERAMAMGLERSRV